MRTIELCSVPNDRDSSFVDVMDAGDRIMPFVGEADAQFQRDRHRSLLVETDRAFSHLDGTGLIELQVVSNDDADGKLVSRDATTVDGGSSVERYEWSGRTMDTEDAFEFNRARHFDPHQGRWISSDPLGHQSGEDDCFKHVRLPQ